MFHNFYLPQFVDFDHHEHNVTNNGIYQLHTFRLKSIIPNFFFYKVKSLIVCLFTSIYHPCIHRQNINSPQTIQLLYKPIILEYLLNNENVML